MARLVTLTPAPVRVTGNGYQNIYAPFEASEFDEFYLITQVIAIEGTPSATISVMTGMQLDTDDGWVSAFSNSVSAVGVWQNQLLKGTFLKSLRWQVSGWSGTTAITFWVGGVGRSFT